MFFLPFFPPPLFPSFSFAPIPRPNFFPPHPFLFFILPFSFIVPPPTKFSAFSQVFRVTGSGSKKSGRISSLTESLSRDDYLFLSLSVMHEGRRSGICIYRSTKKRQQRRNSRLIENQLSTVDSVRSKQRFGKWPFDYRLVFVSSAKNPVSLLLLLRRRKIPDFRANPGRWRLHSQPRIIRE